MRALGLLLCCGCVTAYEPGSLLKSHPDAQNVTLGRVDVMVQPYLSKETLPDSVMLEFRLGNRGERSVAIDFTAIEVELDGETSKPFDPGHELRPAWLAPRDTAHERIIYRSLTGDDPSEVCVRFHRLVAGAADDLPRCFHVENRWPSPHW